MNKSIALENLMDVNTTAGMLGITDKALMRLARLKRIPALKISNKWFFPKERIELFIQEQMDGVR
jgi:hypothetical protein